MINARNVNLFDLPPELIAKIISYSHCEPEDIGIIQGTIRNIYLVSSQMCYLVMESAKYITRLRIIYRFSGIDGITGDIASEYYRGETYLVHFINLRHLTLDEYIDISLFKLAYHSLTYLSMSAYPHIYSQHDIFSMLKECTSECRRDCNGIHKEFPDRDRDRDSLDEDSLNNTRYIDLLSMSGDRDIEDRDIEDRDIEDRDIEDRDIEDRDNLDCLDGDIDIPDNTHSINRISISGDTEDIPDEDSQDRDIPDEDSQDRDRHHAKLDKINRNMLRLKMEFKERYGFEDDIFRNVTIKERSRSEDVNREMIIRNRDRSKPKPKIVYEYNNDLIDRTRYLIRSARNIRRYTKMINLRHLCLYCPSEDDEGDTILCPKYTINPDIVPNLEHLETSFVQIVNLPDLKHLRSIKLSNLVIEHEIPVDYLNETSITTLIIDGHANGHFDPNSHLDIKNITCLHTNERLEYLNSGNVRLYSCHNLRRLGNSNLMPNLESLILYTKSYEPDDDDYIDNTVFMMKKMKNIAKVINGHPKLKHIFIVPSSGGIRISDNKFKLIRYNIDKDNIPDHHRLIFRDSDKHRTYDLYTSDNSRPYSLDCYLV